VALGSQLKERRRTVHAAVARAIEQQDAEHLDERAALLAHHCEEAGEAIAAARWHRRAAEWVGHTDIGAALHHWQRVRALLRGLPIDPDVAALGVAACRQLLNMGWRVGTPLDEARALLEEGQALATSIGDRRAHLKLSMVFARALCSVGDVAGYLDLSIENQRAALEIDDVAVQANACFYLVDALSFAARFNEVLQMADEGLARFPRDIPRAEWLVGVEPHSWFSFWRAHSLVCTGRVPEGLVEYERSRRLSEENGTPEMLGYIASFATEAHRRCHDADRSLANARQLEEISRRLGEPPVMVGHTQLAFGHAHLAAGRAADAVDSARAALDSFGRVEKFHAGNPAALLAEALLESGDPSAACVAADEAIALCRSSLRRVYEGVALGVKARALLRRDGATARDAAEAALAEVAALIEQTGATSLAPALREWRAELAAVLGDAAAREQLLREAERGYREIGAPLQVDRIGRLLAEAPRGT
jgi:adenylate cyclase